MRRKLKVKKYQFQSKTDSLSVRAFEESDLEAYLSRFKLSYEEDYIKTLSAEEMDNMMIRELNTIPTYLIKEGSQNLGYFCFLKKSGIKVKDKTINKPCLLLEFSMEEEIMNRNFDRVLNVVTEFIKEHICSKGSIHMFAGEEQTRVVNCLILAGFSQVDNSKVVYKLVKYFKEHGIHNPYIKDPMYIRNI